MSTPFGRQYWEDLSNSAWVNLGNPPPSSTDQNYDAFRHAYTSALWSFNFGERIAREGGDYIERSNPNNFNGTERMLRDMRGDLLNNAKGREIGLDHPGGSNPSLAERVRDALNRGDLVIDKQTDSRTLGTNFPTDLYPFPAPNNLPGTWEAEGWGGIDPATNNDYNAARSWFPRRDPLTLDLDGDGLETVGIDSTNPILFDHDGDGIANATGWIKPDDGFLVFDRNGDGLINNGTELFGDSTPLATGGNAADGFAALAQEDTNHDGVVNAQDANWASLRVWKDADSDSVTDEGELHTLESQGIAGLVVAKTENTTRLANGNQIADLGHFIKSDGSEGTLGNVTGGMADIDLADNPFYRSFSDTIPSTPDTTSLPDMQGSGALRDLREAASLSPELASAVAAYASADTKAGQMALIDGVISQWAGSTSFQTSIEKADAQGYRLTYLIPGLSPADLSSGGFVSGGGGSGGSSGSSGSGGSGVLIPPSEAEVQRRAALLAQQAAITELIGTLEKFNGLTFVNIGPTEASQFIMTSPSVRSGCSEAVNEAVLERAA